MVDQLKGKQIAELKEALRYLTRMVMNIPKLKTVMRSLGREAWQATVHGAAKGRHNWVTKHIQTSMKEMKIFIQVILRIITQEWPLRKLWELFCPLKIKAQLNKFLGTEGYTLNDVLLTVCTILIWSWWIIITPYKIRKECHTLRSCCVGVGRTLLFMAEQVCLPKGRFGQYIMQIHKASRGQREGRGTFLCLNFSSFAIKYEFHVTVVRRHINSYQPVISMREVQGLLELYTRGT